MPRALPNATGQSTMSGTFCTDGGGTGSTALFNISSLLGKMGKMCQIFLSATASHMDIHLWSITP